MAVGGAWLFALGTLVMLIVCIGARHAGGGDWIIASTTVGDTTYRAIGLTYQGGVGTALAWVEAVVLLSAIVASVLPAVMIRRIGHGVLVAWAALWLAAGIRLVAIDGLWWLWAIWIVPMGLFFLCTIVRAVRGWRVSPA